MSMLDCRRQDDASPLAIPDAVGSLHGVEALTL